MTSLKLLAQWGKEYRREHFGTDSMEPHIEKWISAAVYDLWYGPHDHEDYPGFEKACEGIKEALRQAPSILYVNIHSEAVATDITDEDDLASEDWVAYNRSHVLRAIVGKDLLEYVQ